MSPRLDAIVSRFRDVRDEMTAAIDDHYPRDCVVRVDNPRYHGMGIATRQSDCPLDRLPVELSNGNVWWYELETITERVLDPKEWPSWIRETITARKKREHERRRQLEAARLDIEIYG